MVCDTRQEDDELHENAVDDRVLTFACHDTGLGKDDGLSITDADLAIIIGVFTVS